MNEEHQERSDSWELPLSPPMKRMRRGLDELEERLAVMEKEMKRLAKQVKQLNQLLGPQPQPGVDDLLNSGEWEVVHTYDFKKRTSYILQHKETGERMAHDVLKQ